MIGDWEKFEQWRNLGKWLGSRLRSADNDFLKVILKRCGTAFKSEFRNEHPFDFWCEFWEIRYNFGHKNILDMWTTAAVNTGWQQRPPRKAENNNSERAPGYFRIWFSSSLVFRFPNPLVCVRFHVFSFPRKFEAGLMKYVGLTRSHNYPHSPSVKQYDGSK